MATVLHRVSYQLRRSVNTPEFCAAEWIINPDLSAVEHVPRKYWKIEGDEVREMDPDEKAAIDTAELARLKTAKLEELANEMLSRFARSDADYLAAAAAVEAAKTPEAVEAVKLQEND